jgi:hypothetical protein
MLLGNIICCETVLMPTVPPLVLVLERRISDDVRPLRCSTITSGATMCQDAKGPCVFASLLV